MTRQGRTVIPGGFHSGPTYIAQMRRPSVQFLIATRSCREALDSQRSSGHGNHGRNMKIAMRVHPEYRLSGTPGSLDGAVRFWLNDQPSTRQWIRRDRTAGRTSGHE